MTRSGNGVGAEAVASLVGRMKAEPSRTWSVIVTFLGDAIAPRGGSVWLGTLLALFEGFDVNAPVVRTAVSRLTADDWLDRTRIGRNSFYRFSERGAAEFEQAARRIYTRIEDDGDGALSFALLKPDGDKEATRSALDRDGFAQLSGDLWMGARASRSITGDAIRFSGHAAPEDSRALARACWAVDDVAARYAAFLDAFSPLDAVLTGHCDVGSTDAIIARTLLVHEYRRVVLRDPLLPRALLPEDWPATNAARLCARLYDKLLPGSEAWLNANGRGEDGPLPQPRDALTKRFTVPPAVRHMTEKID